MKMTESLLFVIYSFLADPNIPPTTHTSQDNCDKIEARVEVVNTSSGLKNGSATLLLTKGDKTSIKYIFCEKDGRVLNENEFNKSSQNGLAKGEYICILVATGCTKKISFTID
jgi:hypothetical protein